MTGSKRFQKIVFIEPKSEHIHVYSLVHIPRLGSLLLASMLKQKGYNVSVIVEDMLQKERHCGDDVGTDQQCGPAVHFHDYDDSAPLLRYCGSRARCRDPGRDRWNARQLFPG